MASRYALTASSVTQKGVSQFQEAEKIYNDVFLIRITKPNTVTSRFLTDNQMLNYSR